MGKPDNTERFKSFDVMLPQGARSRFDKLVRALDEAEDLMPDDALDGSSEELRQVLMRLQTAQTNLTELLVYRKILGVD
jgi:hypothetical protein